MYLLTFVLLFILDNFKFKFQRIKLKQWSIDKDVLFKIVVPAFLIFILLAFRHDYVGSDTQNYHYLYNNLSKNYIYTILNSCKDIFDVINQELGFYAIYEIFKFVGLNFRWVLIFSSLLYVGAISILIKKYSCNYIFSYIIFFFYGFFIFSTTQRQAFALSFTIFAFIAAKERKIIKYFIWCLIAVLFHSSALIFLPVYFIVNITPRKTLIYLGIIVSLFMFSFRSYIINFILIFLKNEQYQEQWVAGISTLIILVPLYLLPLLSRNELIKKNTTWIMIALSLILFPLSQYNPFFSRMIMYFQIYYIIYIPYVIKTISMPYNKIIKIIIIVFGLLNFFILKNLTGVRQVPYIFYFQEYPEYIDTEGLFPVPED